MQSWQFRTKLLFAFFGSSALLAMASPLLLAQRTKTPGSGTRPGENDLAMLEAERGNWSRWRGPNNDGVSQEKGLLEKWPADGPPLLWKASGLGAGFSSVAVVDGKVFSMGSKDGTTITCRNAKDGAEIWTTKIGGGGDPNCT